MMRTPTASAIALAIAAGIASRPISPVLSPHTGPTVRTNPRRRHGSWHHRRGGNRIVLEVRIGRHAVVPIEILGDREPQTLRYGARNLSLGGSRMDNSAAIDGGPRFRAPSLCRSPDRLRLRRLVPRSCTRPIRCRSGCDPEIRTDCPKLPTPMIGWPSG